MTAKWTRERSALWLVQQHAASGRPPATSAELLDWALGCRTLRWQDSPEGERFLHEDDWTGSLLHLRRSLSDLHLHRAVRYGKQRQCRVCMKLCRTWLAPAQSEEEAA